MAPSKTGMKNTFPTSRQLPPAGLIAVYMAMPNAWLFAVVFAVIATFAVGIYLAQKSWELAVGRVAESNHPAVHMARRSVNIVESFARRGVMAAGELARRPLQRTASSNALSKAA